MIYLKYLKNGMVFFSLFILGMIYHANLLNGIFRCNNLKVYKTTNFFI